MTKTFEITVSVETWNDLYSNLIDDNMICDYNDDDTMTITFDNINEVDIKDLTEDTLCEWLGIDYEDVLYTNYEDM